MGIDLRKDHPHTAQHAMASAGTREQPTGLRPELLIDASESIAAPVAHAKGKGRVRARFIPTALRITTSARLKHAERTDDFQTIDKPLPEIQRPVKYVDHYVHGVVYETGRFGKRNRVFRRSALCV